MKSPMHSTWARAWLLVQGKCPKHQQLLSLYNNIISDNKGVDLSCMTLMILAQALACKSR